MASSWVSIINSALIKVGATPIMSVDDGSKEANLAKARYEEVRDIVLRMHPWNCAVKRVTLAPLSTTPAFDFSNEFQLPSDCIRLLTVDEQIDYRIEGQKLLADATELNIKYIFRVTNPVQIDVLCAEAIALYLAYDLSYALVQDTQKTEALNEAFLRFVRKAGSVDSQEDGRNTLRPNWFMDNRQGYPFQPQSR
jgi:hypothetical protein